MISIGKNKIISYLLVIILLLPSISIKTVYAESGITISKYIKLLVNGLNLKEEKENRKKIEKTPNKSIHIARTLGIVKKGEFKDYDKKITREQAAVIANRTEIVMEKRNYYNVELYYTVVNNKRIADIKSAAKVNRKNIYQAFVKGIMVGYSNGKYTKDRLFKSDNPLTSKEAKDIVKRLSNKTFRKQLSPDGQVIRTTNLPTNKNSFNYILESFPNEFYQKKFSFQLTNYGKPPKELEQYASPKRIYDMTFKNAFDQYEMKQVLAMYLDEWVKKLESNLYYRFNVNYKTVNKKNYEWLNSLRETYFIFNNIELDSKKTSQIKEYINNIVENKVVIQSSLIAVDPSTLYFDNGYFLRCYIKFKINAENIELSHNKLIFGNYIWIDQLKQGVWMEKIFDIGIGTINGGSVGEDFAVSVDSLIDYN